MLDQSHFNEIAEKILKEYDQISDEFSSFQQSTKLDCLSGCGKCCFKPDIYCTPVELLPLALELYQRGEAESVYQRCLGKEREHCLLLDVTNESKFEGRCSEYAFRPLVCRTFGVSARTGKKGELDFSICKLIKEERAEAYEHLVEKYFELEKMDTKPPMIHLSKHRLEAIDPLFYEEEFPINQSLKIILEKILFYVSYFEET